MCYKPKFPVFPVDGLTLKEIVAMYAKAVATHPAPMTPKEKREVLLRVDSPGPFQ